MVSKYTAACNCSEASVNQSSKLTVCEGKCQWKGNRHTDCKGSPGRSGCKCHDCGNDEDNSWKQHRCQEGFAKRHDVVCGSHGFAQGIDGISQCQKGNSRNSSFNTLGQRIHDFLERNALDYHTDGHENNNEQESLHGLCGSHGDIGAQCDGNDHKYREDEVYKYTGFDARIRLHFGKLFSDQRNSTVTQHFSFFHSTFFCFFHRSEIFENTGTDETNHDDCKNCVEVIGNCF